MKYDEQIVYGIVMMENMPHGDQFTDSYCYENLEDAEKEAEKLSDNAYTARIIEIILRKRNKNYDDDKTIPLPNN